MELKRGRLIDHLHITVRDLAASKRFYTAVLKVTGVPLVDGGDHHFYSDELWVQGGENVSHVHFAFQAADREMVDRWYAAGLAAGGRDNGPPGERTKYHPGYYAAYLFDPDGNNVEAVYHGPGKRSAVAVTITAG